MGLGKGNVVQLRRDLFGARQVRVFELGLSIHFFEETPEVERDVEETAIHQLLNFQEVQNQLLSPGRIPLLCLKELLVYFDVLITVLHY